MKILFCGDIVGKVGRKAISSVLPMLKDKYNIDFTIGNGENITHGKGIIRKHYDFLIENGIDCVTLGNHYDTKKDIVNYIEDVDKMVRPANLLESFPGEGSKVYKIKGIKIRVTNILGNVFMNRDISNPYLKLKEICEEDDSNIHIVDFHAEATSEKQTFGFLFDGKISALLGTHTHVQTNDDKILENGTAYISDVGMCGVNDSILGFEKHSVINKTIFGKDERFKLLESADYIFSAVVLTIDNKTGKCKKIEKIRIESNGTN